MIVYRNLRSDEDPSQGLVARRPGRDMTPAGHIMNANRPNFKGSQYISTTTDLVFAARWRQPGQQTIEIEYDLLEMDAVGNQSIVDVSTPEKAQAQGLKGRLYTYAVSAKEVLLEGRIPPDAIRLVEP